MHCQRFLLLCVIAVCLLSLVISAEKDNRQSVGKHRRNRQRSDRRELRGLETGKRGRQQRRNRAKNAKEEDEEDHDTTAEEVEEELVHLNHKNRERVSRREKSNVAREELLAFPVAGSPVGQDGVELEPQDHGPLEANVTLESKRDSHDEPAYEEPIYDDYYKKYHHIMLERRRQLRIFMLQQHILQQLGLPSQPNTSALYPNYNVSRVRIAIDHLYPENRESLAASTEEYLSKVLQTLPPSCETPRNADRTWDDGSSFRMYFDVPAQKQRADKVDILTTATLKLYKLPVEEDEESECDCRHKPKRKNRPLEQVDDDDDEDTDEDVAERRAQRSRRHGRRKNRTERVSKGEVEVAEEETDREVEEDNIDEQENLDNVNILVYQYRRPVKKNKHENVKLIASIAAPKDKEGWVHLDIKDAVDHWMRHPRKNFGIKIEVQDSQRKEIDPYEIFRTYNCSMELNSNLSLPLAMAMLSADESGTGTGNETGDPLVMNVTFPMLDIVTTTSEKQQQETSTRYKRQAINRRRSRCVMEKMYISLEDLLLDWVVSPQVFETGFCRGSCSVAADHSGAYIRSYRKNAYSPSDRSTLANPTSCCGPTQTKPLNILYFNKDRELTITKINDFIVTECGCRD